MERGEPPGRDVQSAEQSDAEVRSPKPVRINVSMNFLEADTGSRRFILQKPLTDALHQAAVVQEDRGEVRPFNRTIAAVQGVVAKRVNGHVNYVASISAMPELLPVVRERIEFVLAELRAQFKTGLDEVNIAEEQQ